MFIAVPHQYPPYVPGPCKMGTRDCEYDCDACRAMHDSHRVIGDWDTDVKDLIEEAMAYRGHQALKVHALASKLAEDLRKGWYD